MPRDNDEAPDPRHSRAAFSAVTVAVIIAATLLVVVLGGGVAAFLFMTVKSPELRDAQIQANARQADLKAAEAGAPAPSSNAARAVELVTDPTGTWMWSVEFSDRNVEQILKLKREGEKLIGTLAAAGGTETEIGDGRVTAGGVLFTVTRERGGVKTVNRFTAKVNGDVLKGEYSTERDGETQSRAFEARRLKSDGKDR